MQVFLHEAFFECPDHILELVQADGATLILITELEKLGGRHIATFEQIDDLLAGYCFKLDIASSARTLTHEMVLAAYIVGLQSVLILCIADVSIHVLIEDVFEAAYLGRRKSKSEMQESILKRVCGDASCICFVANAEKCFWSQMFCFQLRYKFVQNDLFGVCLLS